MFFNDETDPCYKTVKSMYLGFGDLSTTVGGSPASLMTMGASGITGDTPVQVFRHHGATDAPAERDCLAMESSKISENQLNFIVFH
jgi:hypothetical protein